MVRRGGRLFRTIQAFNVLKNKTFKFPWKKTSKVSIGDIISTDQYAEIHGKPALEQGSTPLFGKPFHYSDGKGFLHSLKEIFADEVYRFDTPTPAPFIIDAGANIGLSVLYFKRLHPRSRIIAFEPDPTIFEVLNKNVASSQLDQVDTRQAAVWTEDGELRFFSEGSLAGSSEVDLRAQGLATMVRAERLKPLLQNEKVDFLKIDIEGAENAVMFDIEDELDNVEHLFFEYHSVLGKDQMLGDLLNIASRKGFRYVINGPHGARLPFIDRKTRTFDLQLNVSCFRL